MQNGEERFLRLNVTHLLHTFLTVFLLLQQLFTADVTAVAFRRDVLTQLFDGGTGNNVVADSRLNRDIELLAWISSFIFSTSSRPRYGALSLWVISASASTRSPLISTSTRTMLDARKRLKL